MQAVASVDGASVDTVELLLVLGASLEPPLLAHVLGCAVGGLGPKHPRGGDAARLRVVLTAARERGLQLPVVTSERRIPHYVIAEAARTGDAERVQALLDAGFDPDPDGVTSEWQWPMYQAVRSGSIAAVELLLRAGADPNKRFGRFGDPLLACVQSPQMLDVLLDASVVLEPPMVIEQGRYDEADGAERVIAGIATGEPAMRSSLASSDVSLATQAAMVRRVIETRSVTPEQVGRALRSVVFLAQARGVEVLLAAGADPHSQPRLLSAVCFGFGPEDRDDWDAERVVALLLEAGIDPDDEDDRGFRPLLTAMSPDTFGPDYQESDGYNGPAALGLIRGGAQVNLVYPETDVEQLEPPKVVGWAPLHVAVHFADVPVVEALLKSGADPRATTPQGDMAIDLARSRLASLAKRVSPELPSDASPLRRRIEGAPESHEQAQREAERVVEVLKSSFSAG
jgi:ankyrin repeat protein